MADADTDDIPTNFLHEIIEADLEAGTHEEVVTRFPPEPNGFLHIGHTKSILLNFRTARKFGGRCHLRFDDTNPAMEDQAFVDAIEQDVRWLGCDWGDHLYFASDYYERLYAKAEELIDKGLAYVESVPDEEVKRLRGTVTEAGTPSPYRDRSVEENLDLFRRMRAGEFEEGAHVLRAKIDLASPNMKMRDPAIYRIKKAHHYRTGDAWCIYPLYDFTHCLSDAFEGITHSLCTLEFENNRELYDWVLDHVTLDVPAKQRPRQYEFARLNLSYTMMSKRKLRQLVEEGYVSGWDDPRMPTVAALRRRGVTPQAIHAFVNMIGVAKNNSTVDLGKLEFCIRTDLEARAPRAMGVLQPLEVHLVDVDDTQILEAPSLPDGGEIRKLPFGPRLFIDRDDFHRDPPKGYRRLRPGGVVRLRYGPVIRCEEVLEEDGAVTGLRCRVLEGDAIPAKVPGVIHWVDAEAAQPVVVRLYDRLFKVEQPESLDDLNPASLIEVDAYLEPGAAQAEVGAHLQLERVGFFCVDRDRVDGRLVLNRTVTLRDGWTKKSQPQPAPAKSPPKQNAPPAPPAAPPPLTDAQQARADAFVTAGVEEGSASTVARNDELTRLLEEALASSSDHASPLGKWVANDVAQHVTGEATRLRGADLAAVIAMVEADRITATGAKTVLEALVAGEGSPDAIVTARGLEQLAGGAVGPIVDQVLAAHPEEVTRFRAGETKLLGFFMGQVMKAARGRADATEAKAALQARLASP